MKKVILFFIIALYFALRLPNITVQPIFADEAIYIRWAQVMRSEPTLRFLPLSDGKTPLFMWTMIPLFKIFQDPLFAGRFLSVVSGLFTLLGVFFLSKKVFNPTVAIWASLFYVITPFTVFFDRMALVDAMQSAFTVWVIYFAIWLVEKNRLDLAMILGFLLGGAILTKTPGLVNLLILPFSMITFKRKGQYALFKLAVLWIVAIGIALIMYNLLRLGPQFHQLSSRNADYVFSPLELQGRILDPFIPHFNDIKDWFPKLFTIPTLLFIALGVLYTLRKMNRKAMVVLIWLLIPLLSSMTLLKTFTARYLLTSVSPLLIFAGFGVYQLLGKIKLNSLIKTVFILSLILPAALRFDYQLISHPPPDDLPDEERRGYFEMWTAGYGFAEIANILIDESKKGKVVVATEGFFGTLPDGLYIYLDKANIAVVGSTATISAEIRQAAKDQKTFFVGNKRNLEGGINNIKLIRQFPKAIPKDNSLQDSVVFYQVLP